MMTLCVYGLLVCATLIVVWVKCLVMTPAVQPVVPKPPVVWTVSEYLLSEETAFEPVVVESPDDETLESELFSDQTVSTLLSVIKTPTMIRELENLEQAVGSDSQR